MSPFFRLMLISVSVITLCFIIFKVKKSKMQIEDTVFWVLFSLLFLCISLFPTIVFFFSNLLNLEDPTNLLYLGIIFILIINQFRMQQKLSLLRNQVKTLIQNRAIENNANAKIINTDGEK